MGPREDLHLLQLRIRGKHQPDFERPPVGQAGQVAGPGIFGYGKRQKGVTANRSLAVHFRCSLQPLPLPGIVDRVFDGGHLRRGIRPVAEPVLHRGRRDFLAGAKLNAQFLDIALLSPLQAVDVAAICRLLCFTSCLFRLSVVELERRSVPICRAAAASERSDIEVGCGGANAHPETGDDPACGQQPRTLHRILLRPEYPLCGSLIVHGFQIWNLESE